MTRENGEAQCISFEHETYFIHGKFNSLKFCIWQVAQVIQMHATMWLIARTRRSGTGYIFMRAFSTGLSPADQMNPWLLSIYESFWYPFFSADRYYRHQLGRWRARGIFHVVIFTHLNFARECSTAVSTRSCLQWQSI